MIKKSYIVLGCSAGVIVLIGAVLAIVAVRDAAPVDKGPDSAALLMAIADWNVSAPDFAKATMESFEHADSSGATVNTRRWTIAVSGDDLVVRQDVRRERNQNDAHELFVEIDPSEALKNDLGNVQKISADAATHADEAIGYCVPRPTGCFVIDYWLRYKSYLVDFSLTGGDLQSGSGEALLTSLDSALDAKLS